MSYGRPDMTPIAPAEDANPAHVDKRGRLPAEATFDRRVYGGISYFAQAATGIVLTNWLTHGGGKRHFTKIAEWLGPDFMTLVSRKKGAEAIEEATGTIIVTTMIMVGNTFLLPVKWLENRKAQIVRGMTGHSNERREAAGETISPEERSAQEHHLALLEQKPKQSWPSLILGRGFALGAVYATLWGMTNPRNQMLETMTANTVKESLNAVGLKSAASSKTVENYSRIAFYDFFYSAVSASGLYVYSHFLHPLVFKDRKPDGEPVMPPLEEAVLEAVENPLPASRRGTNAQPATAVRVDSIARRPEPLLAEVRA